VVGASRFAWISISPHERWNIRSEKPPCTRVTWLWYSSIGLIARLPCSSSRAYGPKTLVSSTRAREPSGWRETGVLSMSRL
jgi:hypothetical protein